MTRTVLLTGATGFVGSNLAPALDAAGYRVRAMTREPDDYTGPGEAVEGDVFDRASLTGAMDGADAAYYLVHSLDSTDFEAKDAEAAADFAEAAAAAGLERIVYLGGLGEDDEKLSPHLRSRRKVEQILFAGDVPVVALRAAVVIGDGSFAWELTRKLIDRLPVLVAPRWAKTRTQPIALPDVVRYLVGVLEPAEALGHAYEIGGADVLRYVDMLQRAARVQGRHVPLVTVPIFLPGLSAAGLATITGEDRVEARNLIDSMSTEVIVHDRSIQQVVPGATLGYDEAVRLALEARAKREATG